MSTTTEQPTTAEGIGVALPDYAATVAECGDPQPVIDELTAWLDGQSVPEILAPVLASAESEPEPAEDETDETSGAEDD